MVPLPSHSKEMGAARRDPRRGESPGVRRQAQFSYRLCLGSGEESRRVTSKNKIKGRPNSDQFTIRKTLGRPFRNRGGTAMKRNENLDFCGMMVLLRHLKEQELISGSELQKIAARIAAQSEGIIVFSF